MAAHPLVIVPTPIGNLEDITFRAVRHLKEADYILVEDTRTSAKLMRAYDIMTPLRSFHMHNEHSMADSVAEEIAAGASVALVTDAGMPGISDPGYLLVRACIKRGLEVTCLPGATAAITALVGSGLPCERFRFEGFLPHKKGRLSRLEALKKSEMTAILYESPSRLVKLLEQMLLTFGENREVVVARELTKVHEEYHRGSLQEILDYFSHHDPLGEIVVLVAPAEKEIREHTNKYKPLDN